MKKRILLISPIPSHPQNAGNRARVFMLGHAIRKLGHDLYFLHVGYQTGDKAAMQKCWGKDRFFQLPYTRRNPLPLRIKRKLRSFFDPEAYKIFDLDAWYDPDIDDALIQLHKTFNFDTVIVEYIFFSKALLCFPDSVLKVIDTHDVFTNRHRLYTEENRPYGWFSTTAAHERKGLNRADLIIAIQSSENAYFASLASRPTVTVGHMVETKIPKTHLLEKTSPATLLFIGSANQSNIDALNFFIDDILPLIKKHVPLTRLLVAGKVCRALNGRSAEIVPLGEVADLGSIYEKVDMAVNPIRIGTGLKIKNIEALGYSKPLVTTTVGAAGLEDDSASAYLVADNPLDFSRAVANVLQDRDLYNRLVVNGHELAVKWNRRQMESLGSALNNTPTGSPRSSLDWNVHKLARHVFK